jgi:hypothetical protein
MTRPTLTDEAYRRTEGVLFRYARNCMRIEELGAELAEVDRQMCQLERELHYWLELSPKSTSHLSGMPGRASLDPPVMRAFEQAEERRTHLYERWTALRKRKEALQEKVGALRLETVRLDIARQRLSEVDRKVFELRYFNEWSNEAIGQELSYSEGTIRIRRKNIVAAMTEVLAEIDITNSLRVVA